MSSILNPVDIDCLPAQPDPQKVDAVGPDDTGELSDTTTLGMVYRVYWVVQSRCGANLNGNEIMAILRQQIELTLTELDVGCVDRQTVCR